MSENYPSFSYSHKKHVIALYSLLSKGNSQSDVRRRKIVQDSELWGDIGTPSFLMYTYCTCRTPLTTESNNNAEKIESMNATSDNEADGFGRHIQTYTYLDLVHMLKRLFRLYFLYHVPITTAKCSALCFYIRIFNIQGGKIRIAIWITQGCVWAWWLANVLIAIFTCTPTRRFWDRMEPGTCVDQHLMYVVTTTPALIIDFMILLLPMPSIWTMQLAWKMKLAVVGVFVVGYS